MAKELINANVILRYLLRDDELLFKKASDLLEKVKIGQETVVILESVLAECVYVLLKIYKVDRRTISEKLSDLFAYKGVANSDKKDLVDSLDVFSRTQLSIVDCLLSAKSLNSGMLLITFNESLETYLQSRQVT